MVYWEESGGHTLNILNVSKNSTTGEFEFSTDFAVIADKYPVPALVLISELVCRGYAISESIDYSIVGINRTIPAVDKEKVKLMKNFQKNDNQTINIEGKEYKVQALSNNIDMIDIFQLKSKDSTIYLRPSGTGPDVRFYIFGKRETYLEEIQRVMNFINEKFLP